MRVQIIETDNYKSLEYKVNEILRNLTREVDINYSTHCFKSGYFIETRYTAMIIFK